MIKFNYIGLNYASGTVDSKVIKLDDAKVRYLLYDTKVRYFVEDTINAVIDTDQVIWFLLDRMTDMTRPLGNNYDMWTTI